MISATRLQIDKPFDNPADSVTTLNRQDSTVFFKFITLLKKKEYSNITSL